MQAQPQFFGHFIWRFMIGQNRTVTLYFDFSYQPLAFIGCFKIHAGSQFLRRIHCIGRVS